MAVQGGCTGSEIFKQLVHGDLQGRVGVGEG